MKREDAIILVDLIDEFVECKFALLNNEDSHTGCIEDRNYNDAKSDLLSAIIGEG